MSQELKSIECDPKCGFRGHDLGCHSVLKMHPELNVTEDQVRSWIKPAEQEKK